MDSKIEVNEADSAMLGHELSMIAALMQAVDWDYFEAAEKALHEAASLYDSGAVLNRAYTPEKGALMRAQVAAMRKLREYREQLIQIDILKAQTVSAQTVLKNMADAFGDGFL